MQTVEQADPYGRGSYCIIVALHGSDSDVTENLRDLRNNYFGKSSALRSIYNTTYEPMSYILIGLSAVSSTAETAIADVTRKMGQMAGKL